MNFLPDSLYDDVPSNTSSFRKSRPNSNPGSSSRGANNNIVVLEKLVLALKDANTRDEALSLLSKFKSEELAPLLWHSFGTMTVLLMEISGALRLLSTPDRLATITKRACHMFYLLECVASHPSTRKKFIDAALPFYIYPFMENHTKEKHYEKLRHASLSVIHGLVKADDPDVINFIVNSRDELLSRIFISMEFGTISSKTVATSIFVSILKKEVGLDLATCAKTFYYIVHTLKAMVAEFNHKISPELLKNIVACCLILSNNSRCCLALGKVMSTLREPYVVHILRDEPIALGWHHELFKRIDAALPLLDVSARQMVMSRRE